MEFYWELEQKDGTIVSIPPSGVEKVKSWLANNQPILLKSAVIPAAQVKAFRVTNKSYSSQPLLEAAAQAFKEPLLNADGSIAATWVKKSVTQREYTSFYSKIPAYKKLSGDGSHVWVAMFLPIEQVNTALVEYCAPEEVERLERERRV